MVKEICGYQDSKGVFHATKEEAETSDETYRKRTSKAEFIDKLNSEGIYSHYSWELDEAIKHFVDNPASWYNFLRDYNGIQPDIPVTVSDKVKTKKWWKL